MEMLQPGWGGEGCGFAAQNLPFSPFFLPPMLYPKCSGYLLGAGREARAELKDKKENSVCSYPRMKTSLVPQPIIPAL